MNTPTLYNALSPQAPRIALVMPVRNEGRYLGATLEQISQQDYPLDNLEIVIADGFSTDNTRDIARSYQSRFKSLQVVDNPGRFPGSGRNLGVGLTSAPYIFAIDGHVHIPSRRLLADMIETFERTGAACLCRAAPPPPGLNPFESAVAVARGSFLGHNPGSDIYSQEEKETDPTSAGAMWRREVFTQIGFFDESFDACEDVDFNYRVKRAGLKAWLSPRLQVFYYPRSSLRLLWGQMVRYGSGRYRFSQKHKRFTVTQLLAPVALGLLVVSVFAALVGGAGASNPFNTLSTIYVVTILAVTFLLALSKRKFGLLFTLPAIFPVIHFGLAWGFWQELVTRRRGKGSPVATAPPAPPTPTVPPTPPVSA